MKKTRKSQEDDYIDQVLQCSNCQAQVSSKGSKKANSAFYKTSTVPGCGHVFCVRCLETKLLNRITRFNCPKCGATITEAKLSDKSPDEIFADTDTINRKKVKEIYNKTQDDFETSNAEGLELYYQYEEMVEDLIYSLNSGIDVEKTWKQIQEYKSAHDSEILAVAERRTRDQFLNEQHVLQYERDREARQKQYRADDLEESTRAKEREKQQNEMLLRGKVSLAGLDLNKNTSSTSTKIVEKTSENDSKSGLASMILLNRQPPRPVRGADVAGKGSGVKSDKPIQVIHQAGGYDFIEYSRRNWCEIVVGMATILGSSKGRDDVMIEDSVVDSEEGPSKIFPASWKMVWDS